MAIKFLDTILSGSLKVSGSYTLPIIDTGSTGFLGQIGINGEVPYFFNSSSGWQAVSGSKPVPAKPVSANVEYLIVAGGGGAAKGGGGAIRDRDNKNLRRRQVGEGHQADGREDGQRDCQRYRQRRGPGV